MSWINQTVLGAAGLDLSGARSVTDELAFFTVGGGEAALTIWNHLSSHAEELGGWPILCGDAMEFSRIEEMFETNEGPLAEILAAVPSGPPAESQLAEKSKQRTGMLEFIKQSNPALYETMKADCEDEEATDSFTDFSTWPAQPSAAVRKPLVAYDFNGKPHKECVLAICRTADPCESPAYLRFGGFNDCPSPAIHVAYLRDWKKRFGAIPLGVTSDVIELFLPAPVMDQSIAMTLAAEQYNYCPDIVDQGTESVENLGKELWGSLYWFFWWD